MIWDLLQAAGQARGQLSEAAHVQTSAFFEQHLAEAEEVHAAAFLQWPGGAPAVPPSGACASVAAEDVCAGRGQASLKDATETQLPCVEWPAHLGRAVVRCSTEAWHRIAMDLWRLGFLSPFRFGGAAGWMHGDVIPVRK